MFYVVHQLKHNGMMHHKTVTWYSHHSIHKMRVHVKMMMYKHSKISKILMASVIASAYSNEWAISVTCCNEQIADQTHQTLPMEVTWGLIWGKIKLIRVRTNCPLKKVQKHQHSSTDINMIGTQHHKTKSQHYWEIIHKLIKPHKDQMQTF